MARGEIHIELAVNYADDPKMVALCRWPKDARATRDLYVQMVCYAKDNMTDGHVPAENIGKLAYPDTAKTGERQVKLLAEVGLIEVAVGGWYIIAFLRRNKSRAEVMALSEVRSASGKEGGLKSGLVRQGEANTKQVANQVPSSGLNTESESESESSSARKRATRITKDWKPTGADIEWQRTENITDAQARRETEKFVSYFLAASGSTSTKRDWSQAWKNWIRRVADEQAPKASERPKDWQFG